MFDDFLSEFNNSSVEAVDPLNRNQCFDLVVAWCDWIGIPRVFPFLYAYQIWTSFPDANYQYFNKVVNTPEAVPNKGDIVVWDKTYNGTAGHTAIATGEGDMTYFNAFSQNDPVGSLSVVRRYDYKGVLGWLRPLKLQVTTSMDRRPYWFDLMNHVIWNLPHEKVTDEMVKDFSRNYTGRLKRSGLWDRVCIMAGLTGDSNLVTVDQLASALQKQITNQLANEVKLCQEENAKLKAKLQGTKLSLTNLANNL